jgi:hypothetical protein
MSGLEEVYGSLHDLILERFKAERGGNVGNAFVAFEFGTPIPYDTFRLRDDDHTLSPELAVEFLSQHANTVPEVKDMLFRRRPFTVDAQYGLMLAGATPVSASGMEMLGAVKRDAEPEYDKKLGSLIGPYRFRPVYATPVNWYDEAATESWTHLAIDRTDTPPPRPQGQPTLNPKLQMWRLASEAVQPVLRQRASTMTLRQMELSPSLAQRELVKPSRAHLRAAVASNSTSMHRTDATDRVSVTRAAAFREAALRPAGRTFGGDAVTRFGRARDFAAIVADGHVAQPAPSPEPAAVKIGSLVALDASWKIAVLLDAGAKQQDVVTNRFSIQVDVCVVSLYRPWLSDALLSLPGWFVPGYDKGEFSDRTNELDGPFAVLPTACILIRNLNITAQWSEQDHAAIENSVNLGSFNLLGRSFDRNSATLTVPGMQSIAWVCEPMPLLPPENPLS